MSWITSGSGWAEPAAQESTATLPFAAETASRREQRPLSAAAAFSSLTVVTVMVAAPAGTARKSRTKPARSAVSAAGRILLVLVGFMATILDSSRPTHIRGTP